MRKQKSTDDTGNPHNLDEVEMSLFEDLRTARALALTLGRWD